MRYDLAVTPNGRPADASPLGKGKRRLSDYEREIAHALIRKGTEKGKAIRMARGLLKKAAATGRWGDHGKAGAKTRAGAAASIAQRSTFNLAFHADELRDPNGRWTTTLTAAMRKVADRLEAQAEADGGPDRIRMPQLSGVPKPGSKADKMFPGRAAGSEVDLTPEFEKWLKKQGVETVDTEVPSSVLVPSQDELIEDKVIGLAKYMETAAKDAAVFEPIFTTQDNHVIDGHHRWAAQEVRNEVDGVPRWMKVRQVQASKERSLALATQFMDEYGLPRADMDDKTVVSKFASLSKVRLKDTDLAFNPNQPRRPNGEWGSGGVVSDLEKIARGGKKMSAAQKAANDLLDGDYKAITTVQKQRKQRVAKALATGGHLNPDDITLKAYNDGINAELEKGLTKLALKTRSTAVGQNEFGNPKRVKLNGRNYSMDEAVKVVADAYDWASTDKGGGGDPTSQDQQHRAQISAKVWSSAVGGDSPPDEQYAASLWEQYQNPDLYGLINSMLRSGKSKKGPDGEPGPKISDLRKYVALMFEKGGYSVEKPTTVYRALKSDSTHDWAKELQPGTEFSDKGIISTTAHMNFSEGWLDNDAVGNEGRAAKPDDVIVEINLPTGQRVVGGDPQFIETMLPPGTRFRVKSSETRQAKAKNPLSGMYDIEDPKVFPYTHVVVEVVPSGK